MISTVLVVGATGHVGRPIAQRLLSYGRNVRVLVRHHTQAQAMLGNGFDYVVGGIDDHGAVARAVDGCDAVHICVAGSSIAEMMAVEAAGTATVAAAAARAGTRLLTYVSGNLVHEHYGPKIAEHKAKIAAEDALRTSGVPYVIFRPTYFMENLPRHVQGRLAVTIGRPRPLHMVAANDFAAMISRAYEVPEAANQELVIYGPEPLTIQEALRTYRDLVRPDLRCLTVPIPVMTVVNKLFMRGKLDLTLQLMRLLERLGERGDPSMAERLLGAPKTTLREWCMSLSPADSAAEKGQ